MKTSLILSTLIFILSLGTISAQGHHHNSDTFSTEFAELIQSYMVLKDALVESEVDEALSAAFQMQEHLEDMGEHRLEGDDHMKWMGTYSKIHSDLSEISGSSKLDEIRIHFFNLSETLIASVKDFDIEGVVYHQHCPMAFSNEGGSWLSNEDQVMNPYMPDTMLRCGRVLEKIES